MRTSVTLDEDIYELASLYAHGRGVSLGVALSELVRKGQTAGTSGTPPELIREPNGLLVFAGKGRPLTSEMVKSALEEEV